MEIIKFINDLRIKQGKISFDDLKVRIMLKWGPSEYYINSRLQAMKLLRLITIDPLAPCVWVLHVLNEEIDMKEAESEVDNLVKNLV